MLSLVPSRVSKTWTSYLDTHITYCIIDYFERWLLVIVIHSSVAMEDGHALLFSFFTITPVHAVIWSVVPLAGKDEETLWWDKKKKQHARTHHYWSFTFKLMRFRCDNQDTVWTVAYKVRRMDGNLVDTTHSATGGYVVPEWFHQCRYSVQDYHLLHSNEKSSHSVYAVSVSCFCNQRLMSFRLRVHYSQCSILISFFRYNLFMLMVHIHVDHTYMKQSDLSHCKNQK